AVAEAALALPAGHAGGAGVAGLPDDLVGGAQVAGRAVRVDGAAHRAGRVHPAAHVGAARRVAAALHVGAHAVVGGPERLGARVARAAACCIAAEVVGAEVALAVRAHHAERAVGRLAHALAHDAGGVRV